jgi:hypothetical protein
MQLASDALRATTAIPDQLNAAAAFLRRRCRDSGAV